MLRIYITRQSRYPADIKSLKERVRTVLRENNVTDAVVNVALVGERKIRELGQKYLEETEKDPAHEVLSFPYGESGQLGDIAICYPEARKIAIKKNRLMDDVLGELAEHGILHLLGKHHE
ncbi:MAG: rRNA maturation RNase YbeY [Patescibacteria group bacterium]